VRAVHQTPSSASAEAVSQQVALERTIARERANRSGLSPGLGLLDYEAEDALLAEIGLGHHQED
jgi:hypothetical protein